MRGLQFSALGLLAAIGCTSCSSSGGSDGPTPTPASITVTPNVGTLALGGTLGLAAIVRDTDGNPVAGQSVTWTSNNTAVATVSGQGSVTALAAGNALVIATAGALSDTATITVSAVAGPVVAVTLGATSQTWHGWEAHAQSGQVDAKTTFAQYQGPLLDSVANDLGITRVRLEVRYGAESPTDFFSQWLNGQITEAAWKPTRYASVNDDGDPNHINPAGFQWSEVDNTVTKIVNPLRQRLQAQGKSLYINLCYVDFAASAFEHKGNPAEYAELMLALFQHLQATYGWTPDAVEMILEPDNSGAWSAAQIAAAMVAAAARLQQAGFTPQWIAPSTVDMGHAPTYFDAMMGVSGVPALLDEISYHRYSGVSAGNLQAIAARGVAGGYRTSMLEHIGADVDELYDDLTIGRVSAWQQFTIAFPTASDNGGALYMIDTTQVPPRVNIGSRTKLLRQYMRYIQPGDVRVGASSNLAALKPVAFKRPNGKAVVVVRATGSGTFSVIGLPPGTYGIEYTTTGTGAVYKATHADATITAGAPLATSIPGPGVLTIFAR